MTFFPTLFWAWVGLCVLFVVDMVCLIAVSITDARRSRESASASMIISEMELAR